MAYNDTPQEFIDSLTKENCPPKWVEEAKRFKNNLSSAPEDQRRVYRHIIENILFEEKVEETTGSKKKSKVEPVGTTEEVIEEEVIEESTEDESFEEEE